MLPQAVLPQAVLPQAVLPQAVLPQAVLPQAILPRAVLPKAILPKAVLPKAARPLVSYICDSTDNVPEGSPVVPASTWTSDDRVFETARKWIRDCEEQHPECRHVSTPQTEYPTRLLHIESTSTVPRVRLVSQKHGEQRYEQPPMTGHYVSLSHCWGQKHFNTLTSLTLSDYLNSVPWEKLPLTFRDAIQFAAKLGISWIWIDALCILQGKDEASREDWLYEASRMREVYKNAYFNISATASRDSSEGVYRARDDTIAWVDRVTLNTEELLGGPSARAMTGEVSTSQQLPRCTILDLSFWQTYVDTAPVNVRSWVFQERLLAPRVIHFCEDQIAFECRVSDRAECRPDGLPHYQMHGNEIIDGARLKSFNAATGRRLRLARLRGKYSSELELEEVADPEDPRFKRLYYYELWKRIVDSYTKMQITEEKDRLIALSGIAREMASEMDSQGLKDKYIAGMWQQSIAQQLLWHVNEGTGDMRQPYQDSRPRDRNGRFIYRAPSFSWGSVESRRGVSFPDPTDARPLIRVNVVRLIYERGKESTDTYGLLTDGYIVLKGVLRKIELTDTKAPRAKPTITNKLHVRVPSQGDQTQSDSRPYQQTTYFVSLGIYVSMPCITRPYADYTNTSKATLYEKVSD